MGSNNSDLDAIRRENEQLRRQLDRGREAPHEMIRRILAAERARMSMGRTRKSTFTTPGISSMESLLREY